MQAQGFGRKGFPAGGAAAASAPMRQPVAPAAARRDPNAEPSVGFLAQERNAAADASTLAWNTPISGRSWNRSRLIAYLLWFFVGGLGAHRLYCGRYISGALQAIIEVVATSVMVISPHSVSTWGPLMLILCVWFVFDAFLIPGMCRRPPAAY